MSTDPSIDRLAGGIEALSHGDPANLTAVIEGYLESELHDTPRHERLPLLQEIMEKFQDEDSSSSGLNFTNEDAARLLSFLSGTSSDFSKQSPQELYENFAASMNTLFDTLNQIIAVINANLLGEKPELETIRHVIGHQIGGGGESSLKEHLEQIQQAFLISHRAFQESARAVVNEMLVALDPDTLSASTKSILNFGPMRKAEIFELYQEKFRECRQWFDRGRFSEKLLREFEKICQQRYRKK